MNTGPSDQGAHEAGALEPIRAGLLHDGVALVPDLVPADLCARARCAIDDWVARFRRGAVRAPPPDREQATGRGLVPIHQHPAFWDVRQYPPLYRLFRALLGTPFLWTTIDEGVHDAPAASREAGVDDDFTWRVDPRVPGRRLRGMVLLSDARADAGAFRCVPHIFRNPEPWWAIHGVKPIPAERIRPERVHSVRGDVGSLVLWDARLPSGRGANRTNCDRYGMFVAMDEEGDEPRRRERLRNFEEARPPAWARTLPGQPQPGSLGTASLSDLGERLLGRRAW